MNLISHVIIRLKKLLENYRIAPQEDLSQLFDIIQTTFDDQDKLGRVLQQTWYQTPEGLKTETTTQDQPIYNVKTLPLPPVKGHFKTYRPQISETLLASNIFPEIIPEVISRRFDLSIYGDSDKLIYPPIQFEWQEYSQPKHFQKHEIRFKEGKELSTQQVRFIKSIFDASIAKLT